MKHKAKGVIALIFLLSLIIIAVVYHGKFNFSNIHHWVLAYRPWTPIVFILLYIIGSIFFLPGSVLTMTGGLLFGPWLGTLYNLIGASLGSTCALLVSRYLLADWVRTKLGTRANNFIKGVEQEGWRFVIFVRLVPVFPFNLTNYSFGLTRIGVVPCMIASFFSMIPATFAYSYAGSLGERFVNGSGMQLFSEVLIAIGLLMIVSFIPWFVRRYKKRKSMGL